MRFSTVVRDCLHLHWAVPLGALPPLPDPLSYDVHYGEGKPVVFASAALFRLERLHLRRLPLIGLSYPQLTLRLCVVDGDGVAAHYLPKVLVPPWAVPAARLVALKPVRTGVFDFPRGGLSTELEGRWRVRRRGTLDLSARLAAAGVYTDGSLGDWRQTVRYFDQRPFAYFCAPDALRRLEIDRAAADAVPIEVELARCDLVPQSLEVDSSAPWPQLHSAWYQPEIAYSFEVAIVPEAAVARQLPAPG